MGSYRLLAKECDYPLHLGITEAGGLFSGTVRSSIGLGLLLLEGIGDTIRVSLSADPVEEVKAGLEILKSLGLKNRGVKIISCPSCARQAFEVIKTVEILEKKLSHIKEPMTLSIIGCVVNGPGESKHANIGISLPGTGERPVAPVYIDGEKDVTLKGDRIAEDFQAIVEQYVADRYC